MVGHGIFCLLSFLLLVVIVMNYVLVAVLDIVVSSSLIVRLFSRLIPMLIVTDRVSIYYDLVMTNSWDIILRIGVQGCFFHLCQSTWRHVQDLGLTALYNADDVAKHFVGMLDGLALLPLADVPAGMAHLRANTPQHLDDVVDYFDATYVTGRHRVIQPPAVNAVAPLPPARIRRQPPLFAPDVWNVHVATVTGADRTNNMCESWNSAFQRLVGHQHPGVWTLVRCLRKDAAVVSTLIVQESRDAAAKASEALYVELQARLKYLCDARAAGTKTVEEMLEGVGHLIRM